VRVQEPACVWWAGGGRTKGTAQGVGLNYTANKIIT